MGKERVYKSEESKANERAHHFGAPNGNPRGEPRAAVQQREFLKWVEQEATAKELSEYVSNENNPVLRRNLVSLLLASKSVGEHFALCNQAHGLPKQSVEIDNKPTTLIIRKS